jgi:hypothetical protein
MPVDRAAISERYKVVLIFGIVIVLNYVGISALHAFEMETIPFYISVYFELLVAFASPFALLYCTYSSYTFFRERTKGWIKAVLSTIFVFLGLLIVIFCWLIISISINGNQWSL